MSIESKVYLDVHRTGLAEFTAMALAQEPADPHSYDALFAPKQRQFHRPNGDTLIFINHHRFLINRN